MWNWLNQIFKTNYQSVEKPKSLIKEIGFIQISTNWDADSVNPQVNLQIDRADLIMDIYTKFTEGNKVKIKFNNCAEYSLNTCNDEGYYYGQYRTNPTNLPWGEFYEIISGLDRNYPEPIIKIQADKTNKRHFIFFFKDETFECLADDYDLEFYNEN